MELYLKFFPEASDIEAQEFVEVGGSAETMAEFQGLLLGFSENPGSMRAATTTTKSAQDEEAESVPAG